MADPLPVNQEAINNRTDDHQPADPKSSDLETIEHKNIDHIAGDYKTGDDKTGDKKINDQNAVDGDAVGHAALNHNIADHGLALSEEKRSNLHRIHKYFSQILNMIDKDPSEDACFRTYTTNAISQIDEALPMGDNKTSAWLRDSKDFLINISRASNERCDKLLDIMQDAVKVALDEIRDPVFRGHWRHQPSIEIVEMLKSLSDTLDKRSKHS